MPRRPEIGESFFMDELGVIHGRFQVLHLGHVEFILAAKARCRHLIIGITNPEPEASGYDNTCPHRSQQSANPFTYYERHQMLVALLTEAGVARADYDIVPFPINFPDKLGYYAPGNAKYYLTIYDAWGEKKLEVLRGLGLEVSVLWRDRERITSGQEVRTLIAAAKPWAHLVPATVHQFILKHGLDRRIRV